MNELRGLVVTPDGAVKEQRFPATSDHLLEALSAVINCDNVDVVRLGPEGNSAAMYVDENGMNIDLPMVNEYATILVYGLNLRLNQFYYGTAVFLGGVDDGGDDTSLSDESVERIRDLMDRVKRGEINIDALKRGLG
ncbi:DUF3846 domain-containing protein [Amycolatopsis sp. lyj-84]|uniref:DUF3846 domain-containing protein n=1 Tax=Amycolatopsis sp. lyj-84 TaxID=2789284 RepID=UPI00397887F4